MSQDAKSILITGATGNVGRHVVSQLLNTDARIRALTRNPAVAGLPPEVDVRQGDLLSPSTLNEHLDDVDAVFLVWRSPETGAAVEVIKAASQRARRLVFLSSSAIADELPVQTNPIGKMHAEIENAIEQSGLEWTFLRPGGFASNVRQWWAPQIRQGDVVRWPYCGASWAPIHERDIAAVAVRALTEDGHGGKKYVLTGPEALSVFEQVQTIGEAIGRRLRVEEISRETAREQMVALMPPWVVELLLDTWAAMAGHPPLVTSTVKEITGEPAHTFRQWAADHAADFQFRPDPSSDRLPDITRRDVGAILASEWIVGTTERQRVTIEAFANSMERNPWPQGLISANLYASTDGTTVLLYGQWTSEGAYQEYMRTQRRSLALSMDAAVPGIERRPAVSYQLYRSTSRNGAGQAPGCIVAVNVEFDGPDPQRQRRRVDAVLEALGSESHLPPGGIAGHFHISTDATRVLNYAEWASEEDHVQALASSGQGSIGSGPKWRDVQNFLGVKSSGFKRYHISRSFVPQLPSNQS